MVRQRGSRPRTVAVCWSITVWLTCYVLWCVVGWLLCVSVPWGLQAFGCYCWTGLPLRLLLHQVGVTSDCVDVVFTGYDAGMEHGELRYFQHSLEIHDPVIDHSMICWMHNGVELIPNHGFPLRLMVPAWYGNANIKSDHSNTRPAYLTHCRTAPLTHSPDVSVHVVGRCSQVAAVHRAH